MTPITLGRLHLPTNIAYAPLAGCSDYPFRKLVREYHKGLVFCEMVKMEALIRRTPSTMAMLKYSEDMRPIGAQICGANVNLVEDCSKIIEDLGFDVIDLNCGCPVDKITKDGSGSALLKEISLLGRILNKMVTSVNIPVTVKIRIGWNDDHFVAREVVRVAEEMGAVAISIHGRTREQGYKGFADLEKIGLCAQVPRSIKVFGNGDIFTKESAKKMMDTGVDGILISRGALYRPWLSRELSEGSFKEPSPWEVLLKHVEHIEAHYPIEKIPPNIKRIFSWYSRKSPELRNVWKDFCRIGELAEMKRVLERYRS